MVLNLIFLKSLLSVVLVELPFKSITLMFPLLLLKAHTGTHFHRYYKNSQARKGDSKMKRLNELSLPTSSTTLTILSESNKARFPEAFENPILFLCSSAFGEVLSHNG